MPVYKYTALSRDDYSWKWLKFVSIDIYIDSLEEKKNYVQLLLEEEEAIGVWLALIKICMCNTFH